MNIFLFIIGSGKSTLMNTLLRLYSYNYNTYDGDNTGSIHFDNMELCHISKEILRGNSIYVVPQEVVLFSESIRFNLDPQRLFTDEVIMKAMTQSGFMTTLVQPQQPQEQQQQEPLDNCNNMYDTKQHCILDWIITPFTSVTSHDSNNNSKVNEDKMIDDVNKTEMKGTQSFTIGLSQGQKQLLCITRLFLQHIRNKTGNVKAPMKILLLDEVTASMDSNTRSVLKDSLLQILLPSTNQPLNDITLFMIVHKLEDALGLCDMILELDHGRVIRYESV